MERFEKRKLKSNIYKHGNAIMYTIIFVMASVITIAAAANRTDKIAYVDDSQLTSAATESVDIKNSSSQKVAATETFTSDADETEMTEAATTEANTAETNTTEVQTSAQETEQTSGTKVKVTADSLNVRAEASLESETIGSAVMNQEFEVISINGDWLEINFDGKKGFINSEFVEFTE